MRRRRSLRGLLPPALAASALLSSPSCQPAFEPGSEVDTLRIFAVVADDPYLAPGDTEVVLKMTYADALADEARPVQITWLGGCFNPPGDLYFACYEQLAAVLEGLAGGSVEDFEGVVLQGQGFDTFTLKVPPDLATARPVTDPTAPQYGSAYVFFMACAGTVGFVPPSGTGRAGDFPLGCFDGEGNRLGPESFIPGFTQLYSFADARTNANPPATGIDIVVDGVVTPIPEEFDQILEVKKCPITEDERRVQGCSARVPADECTVYDIEVAVPPDVAELDVDALSPEGVQLREAVWVDYYVDGGNVDAPVKLVSDPTTGINDAREVTYVPPDTAGLVTIWAVVHDARGGATVVQRYLRVVD